MNGLLGTRTTQAVLLVFVLALAPVPNCRGEPSAGAAQSASEAPSAQRDASDAEGAELDLSFKALHRLPVPGPDMGAEGLDPELFLGAQTIKGKPYSHAAAPFQEVSRPKSNSASAPAASLGTGHNGAAVPAPARSNVLVEAVRKAEALDPASKKMTSFAAHSEGTEVPGVGYTRKANADSEQVTSAYVRAVEQRGQPPRADTGRRRESHATRTATHAAKSPAPGTVLPNVTSPHVRAVEHRGQPPRADTGRRRESHATRNATHDAKGPTTSAHPGSAPSHVPVSTSAEEQAIAAALLLQAILGQQVSRVDKMAIRRRSSCCKLWRCDGFRCLININISS